MNLKDFLAKDSGRKVYWSLVLESGWIQAGIWEVKENKAEIVSLGPATAWETESELIGAADTALSAAVQKLPEDFTEPSETVFGIPSSWVTGGQIKEDYLEKIKNICRELSLSPTGFVVIPEAIANLAKSEEGSPLNAIVLGIGRDDLEVTVFKLGNLAGTTSVSRSVSLIEDISEGLSRFGEGELPSRILIYDGKEGELEEARQAIINVNWEEHEKVKFLHTPKIEILTPERKVLATSLAGASEMAQVSGLKSPKEVAEEKTPQASPELGFVVGKDVTQKNAQPPDQPRPLPGGVDSLLEKIRASFFSFPKSSLLFGGGLVVAFFLLGLILWIFLPKATVTIFISPKKLEESSEITVDPKGTSYDFSTKTLPAEILNTEVSGDKTKATTGTKIVGEKAKGTLKIQNGTSSSISLPAGTFFFSASDLKFTLDQSASVSPALSPATPGTADVQVTAADIGAQFNLAKDETFKVGNYSKADVDATSTTDFSGGTSREISAVSGEDQKNLESDLTDELVEKAKGEFAQNLSSDKFLVEDSLSATASSRIFSNKIGDEAANLKLSLTLKAKAFSVIRRDLTFFAGEVLKAKVPSGYILRENQLEFEFKSTKESDNTFDLKIIANFLPEVKVGEIAKKLRGAPVSSVKSYLSGIPGFVRAEIDLKPRFPGRFGTLPWLVRNITVEVAAEK